MAPANGVRPLAARHLLLLLTRATPARPASPVLRRQGRRRQDHLRRGVRARGEPGGAPHVAPCPPTRRTRPPTCSKRASGRPRPKCCPASSGLEIDAAREARRYVDEAKQRMSGLFRPAVLAEAARQIELTASMPGVADLAVFDRMSDLVAVARRGLRPPRLRHGSDGPRAADAPHARPAVVVGGGAGAATAGGAGGAGDRGRDRPRAHLAEPDPVLAILEARRRAPVRAASAELARADRVAFVLGADPGAAAARGVGPCDARTGGGRHRRRRRRS